MVMKNATSDGLSRPGDSLVLVAFGVDRALITERDKAKALRSSSSAMIDVRHGNGAFSLAQSLLLYIAFRPEGWRV